MLITCPKCKSVFRLPKPNDLDKKLRCSICKTVFAVRDADYELEEAKAYAFSLFYSSLPFVLYPFYGLLPII